MRIINYHLENFHATEVPAVTEAPSADAVWLILPVDQALPRRHVVPVRGWIGPAAESAPPWYPGRPAAAGRVAIWRVCHWL